MNMFSTRGGRAALFRLVGTGAAVGLATIVAAPADAAVVAGLNMKVWNGIPYIDYYPTSSTIDQEVAYTNAHTPDSVGFFAVPDASRYEYFAGYVQAVNFSGFLNVGTAGTYTFSVDADDAARITLDGNTLLEATFYQGTSSVSTYLTAGSHSYNAFHFQGGGGTYFFANLAGPAGATFSASAAVPEPATWGMMLLGFGGVGYALRRRNQTVRIRFA